MKLGAFDHPRTDFDRAAIAFRLDMASKIDPLHVLRCQQALPHPPGKEIVESVELTIDGEPKTVPH